MSEILFGWNPAPANDCRCRLTGLRGGLRGEKMDPRLLLSGMTSGGRDICHSHAGMTKARWIPVTELNMPYNAPGNIVRGKQDRIIVGQETTDLIPLHHINQLIRQHETWRQPARPTNRTKQIQCHRSWQESTRLGAFPPHDRLTNLMQRRLRQTPAVLFPLRR